MSDRRDVWRLGGARTTTGRDTVQTGGVKPVANYASSPDGASGSSHNTTSTTSSARGLSYTSSDWRSSTSGSDVTGKYLGPEWRTSRSGGGNYIRSDWQSSSTSGRQGGGNSTISDWRSSSTSSAGGNYSSSDWRSSSTSGGHGVGNFIRSDWRSSSTSGGHGGGNFTSSECGSSTKSGGHGGGGGNYSSSDWRSSGESGYRSERGWGSGRGSYNRSGARNLPALTTENWESARSALSDDVANKLTVSTSRKAMEVSKRPGFGHVGHRCLVKANHFLVDLADTGKFYRYHVAIEPAVSTKLNKDIMVSLLKSYKESDFDNVTPAYDGRKLLFTTKELPFTSREFIIRSADHGTAPESGTREFLVKIMRTSSLDTYPLQQFLSGQQLETPNEIIHAFDVVLRSVGPLKNYSSIARSLYSPSMGRGLVHDGLEHWKGLFQRLRPIQMGLSLNIDSSARAFYEPVIVTEFISKNLRGLLPRNSEALTNTDLFKIKKALEGLMVQVIHREDPRRYKVLGLSTQPCNKLMLTLSNGCEQSVALYFDEKYHLKLRYPSLPCLEVGSAKRLKYLPMEVCRIVEGQRYTKKLSHRQVSELLNATALRPHDRAYQVQKMVEHNNYNGDYLVKEFGLHVNNSFTQVEARVLPPPKLLYNGNQPGAIVDPSVGQWKMSNQKLHEPGTVRYWACVNFSSNVRETVVEDFCFRLVNECRTKGLDFTPRPLIQTSTKDDRQLEEVLRHIHNDSGKQLQLLIIIIPEYATYYGKIKQLCETELGIITQCCNSKKVLKAGVAYLENVALKINVKIGGRNVALLDAANYRIPLVTEDPTIIFGADVTHPLGGEDSSPSIAAVVASMDWPYFTKYRGLVFAQPHRKEIILDLLNTVKELLLAFERQNGVLPRRIIFYRDGVSDGEFSSVLLLEVCAIREACQSIGVNYMPFVTFIVVVKRHHTRLFPEDPNMMDNTQNILPGTVVDSKICHPSQFDFYLCSHAGIKGTSRPVHYHVLYDENNFTPDLIQLFTNSLCYTYARCTRSVSIVPPVYYAHLAAFRARKYMEGEAYDSGSSRGNAGKTSNSPATTVRPLPKIKDNILDVMFYC